MYIFIATTIPAGSLMLTLNTINALNQEIKALKLILPIVIFQILLQLFIFNRVSISIYASTYLIFTIIYVILLKNLAKKSLLAKV